MRSNIIKKGTADEVRCAVTELRLSETFMGVPQLSVKVVSPVTVDIEIGDYIVYDYNGVTYTLREMPGREKHARPSTYGGAFVYNLVFHGPEWDLRNAPFLDLVLYDNGQHFTSMPDVTTYEDVYGIAARVQANMDNMYPGKWEIRVVSGLSADSTLAQKLSETQDFSLSDGKCLDALSQVYSQWGVSFVYSYENGKHVITIGGAETQEDTTGLFMYGRGNGLKVIKSSVQNASEIATRYYVYGGTQNMLSRYYNKVTYMPEIVEEEGTATSGVIGILLMHRTVIGSTMYIPNLMIPVSKWGKSIWYAWYGGGIGFAFTFDRVPKNGDYAFGSPNVGSFLGIISSVSSNSIICNGESYVRVASIRFPDIRKAYIDAPQSYIDKYGIRPATLRFDGSGEREDIHPSIKGLTIGDIRTGLGSGAEYYPSTSVYTDPDERVDKVLSCDNPADDGLNTEDGNKYVAEDSVINNSIIREYEMKVRDDGWRGYMKGKTYLSGNYGKITVTRKGYLDFRLPLVATVENGEQYNITAGVEVYKTDTSGHLSLIIQYTTTNQPIKGNPEENIYFGTSIHDNKISVDEGDTLSISLWFQAITDNVLLNTIKWTIPEFTMVWKYELSLENYFYIKLKQIGFDISKITTNDGEYPVISMTSGQCGGYEFEIHDATYNASDDSWILRCARMQDGTLGQWFPNNIFKIEPEDSFVLLNIALPEVYITANEQRLYDAALAERLYEERPLLEPEIDSKVMAESPQVLRAGMWFSVKDADLGLAGTDGGSYLILIDSVEVTDKPDTIRSFKVTLRNNKEDNVFTLMQKQIIRTSASMRTEQRNQTKTSVTKAPESNSSEGSVNSADFVTLSTAQTITGKKTFAEDAVFGADGGRLFIPSGDTPGTYDIFVDPGMAVEGEEPTGGSGSGTWETWEDAAGTDVPVGFHRVKTGEVTTFEKGHFYFYSDIRKLYLATGTTAEDMEVYSSSVDDVRYSPSGKKITVTFLDGRENLTIDLSVFAEKTQLGDLSILTTTAKTDLVSAINEVAEAVEAGGSGGKVTVTEKIASPQQDYSKIYEISQGGILVGSINIPRDMVVSSGTVETNPDGQPTGTYLVLTLANATSDKVYINVGSLVDIYTAAKNATQVQLSINSVTREISASIVAGSITTTELASKCVTGAKLADGAVSTSHISNGAVSILKLESSLQTILKNALSASDITTGKTNGSIAVEGKDVPVKGLGSAAYKDEGYFVTLSTAQTITGKKTFAEDAVFGADGSRLFIPSGDTPGTYDIFVDPGMAIEGDAPAPGGGGLDEDELWRVLQDAGTETISKNHLPSDTLYSDDLNGYATQTWVQGQGYITSASLDPYAKTEDIQKWVDDSFVRTSELPSLDGYLEWGSVTSPGQYVSVTDGNGVSHNLSLSTHTHKVRDITDFPQTWEWSKISGAPTTLSGYGITDAYTKTQVNEALKAFVTLSTEQTITGRKTFAEDVVFGADGGRMFIPSATPGTYDLFVDSGMAIEGEAPSGGAYLLNDLHNLTSEATSDDIEFVIGSYDALRQAIRNGKVIVDNRTMDYDYDRLVAVDALDGGNENFISLTFHSSMYQTRRYVISRDGSGNLSLTVTDSGSFLSDSHSYSQLDTENKTVLGAINEVAGKVSDALPYWCGRVLSTGQLTKMSGSGNISVRHTATGVYSVQGATPGMSVTVTPLNFTNSLVTLEPLTAAILQNSSNGLITIHIFNSSGTRVNSAFSLLII